MGLLGPDWVLVRFCRWMVSYLLLSSSRSGVGFLLTESEESGEVSQSVFERLRSGGGAEEAEPWTRRDSSLLPV